MEQKFKMMLNDAELIQTQTQNISNIYTTE